MVNGLIRGLVILVEIVPHLTAAASFPLQTEGEQRHRTDTLKCYTCVNVSDNVVCNRFAIEVQCSEGNDFCHTLHIMDSNGDSVAVNKKCANSSECWSSGVGCLKIDTQTICISCCDETYCNVTVPTNQSNAIFSNKRTSRRNDIVSVNNGSHSGLLPPPPSIVNPNLLQICAILLIYSKRYS